MRREIVNYLQASGLVNIDLSAIRTFEIVRAGLQLSLRMSKLTLPAQSTLQWQIRVLKTTCKPEVKMKKERRRFVAKTRVTEAKSTISVLVDCNTTLRRTQVAVIEYYRSIGDNPSSREHTCFYMFGLGSKNLIASIILWKNNYHEFTNFKGTNILFTIRCPKMKK